jgi:hypothetical protein
LPSTAGGNSSLGSARRRFGRSRPALSKGERIRRIGVLVPGNENDPLYKALLSAFAQALSDLNWTDGRNVRMDLRWGRADMNRIDA